MWFGLGAIKCCCCVHKLQEALYGIQLQFFSFPKPKTIKSLFLATI